MVLKGVLRNTSPSHAGHETRRVGLTAARAALADNQQCQAPIITKRPFLKIVKEVPSTRQMMTLGWRISSYRGIPGIRVKRESTEICMPQHKSCVNASEPIIIPCRCADYIPSLVCARCETPYATPTKVDITTFKTIGCSTHSARRTYAVCCRRIASDSEIDIFDPDTTFRINQRFCWFKRGTTKPAKGLKLFSRYSGDWSNFQQSVLPFFLLKAAAELLASDTHMIVADSKSNTVQIIKRY